MMFIVGERINSSRPKIAEAIKAKDADHILNEARGQKACGASVIDVNCAMSMEHELDDMLWLVKTIQKDDAIELCIDSPNPEVIKAALAVHKGRAMVNSITAEKERYEKILPVCANKDCSIIALTMDEKGMPSTAEERFELATIIMEIAKEYGVSRDRLYFDPLIRPLSTEQSQAKEILKAIKMISEIGLKTIAGLSNISYGLPNRRLINRTFLTMAYASGMTASIVDPLDKDLMSAVMTSSVVLDRDEYAQGYIQAFREGKLVK